MPRVRALLAMLTQSSAASGAKRLDWGEVGAMLAVVTAAWVAFKAIVAPGWQRLWMRTAKACRVQVKAYIDEMYAPEIAERARTAQLAAANHDKLEYVHAALTAQGKALEDVPRMSGVLMQMDRTLGELNRTLSDLHKDVREHGQEIGRLTGAVEAWDGHERRSHPRRADDAALSKEEA